MNSKLFFAALLSAFCLRADFSYEESSRITGGMLMQFVGMMGEKGNVPTVTTVAVKGNRMVYRVGRGAEINAAQIIDIDKETITRLNFDQRTWSILTFAQMRDTLDKVKQTNDVQAEGVAVALKEAKETKKIGDYDAKEVVMTVIMQGKDSQTGTTGKMTISDDVWVTEVSGSDQIRAFHKRMGQKLDWAPGGNPAMVGTPDVARAMAAMFKQGAKFEGLPVHQVLTLVGKAGPAPAAQADTEQTIMEITTDITKHSADSVDVKWFEVPEGFKRAENPVKAAGK